MCQTISIAEKCMTRVAGVLLTGYQLRKQLCLGDPGPEGIVEALEASRSQMYAMAELVRLMIDDGRGPGRPPVTTEATDSTLPRQLALSMAVSQWLREHPGAVYSGRERTHYSDRFRGFVVDLLSPGGIAHALTRDKAAFVMGMSVHTLTHWLSAKVPITKPEAAETAADDTAAQAAAREPTPDDATGIEATPVDEPAANDEPKLPGSQWAATAAQVLDLWSRWKGTFAAFCRSLPANGIDYSYGLVRSILAVEEQRPFKKRRDRHPDAEAIRGELARLFPNAQWNADGKSVLVQVGDATYRFNWELVVDNATTGHLGFSIRDHEDSAGVLEALQQAEDTAGEPPVAFVRDPRKCNTAATIEEELEKKKVVSMFSPVGRPQSNSPAENAFSLFQQKMPPIYIPEGLDDKQLAQLVLWYVLFAYSAGRNQTPRRRLKGKTPAQAFEDAAISEEQKAQAREQLRELRRRIEEQEAANRRRCAPALKQLLTDFFTENGLDDPNERYIAQIGSYGIEAALEAMAVFLAKTEAGTLSERNHERYLLGIARNVAYRREDQRTYGHLLDLRAKAGDLVIEPLIKHEKELSATLTPENYRNELLNLALDSSTTIDRFFWRRRFLEVFEALSHAHKQQQGRWCARRIASRSKLPHRERDQFIALLAEAAMPLAA